MKRLLLSALIAASFAGAPAFAGATEEGIVQELTDQGFTRIQIQRTLLGRTRVLATGPNARREIVFNPATGAILRDYWSDSGEGSAGGSSIFSPGDDDDDDDRDDDDRDDDDDDGSDSSGSDDDGGSSGSGSSDDSDDDSDDDDSDDDDSGDDDGGDDDDD